MEENELQKGNNEEETSKSDLSELPSFSSFGETLSSTSLGEFVEFPKISTPITKKKKMGSSDAVMMFGDPKNLTQIIAYCTFEPPFEVGVLRKAFFERVLEKYPRFSLSVKLIRGNWHWMPHEFDITKHVKVIQESMSSQEELQNLVSRLSEEALPNHLPLWDAQLIPHYTGGEGNVDRSAVIFRLHHALGDGVGLMQVLLGLMDKESEDALPPNTAKKSKSFIGNLVKVPTYGVYKIMKLTFSSQDRNGIHQPVLSGSKKLVWTKVLNLTEVKEIKNKTKTTVNDVLISCVAGAFEKIFKGGKVIPKVRAAVPYNRRKHTEGIVLKNDFALLVISLPTGPMDELARLHKMKKKMDEKKESVEPLTNYGVQTTIMKTLPPKGVKTMVNRLLSRITCIITNVPGPSRAMNLGGHKLAEFLFWVPQRANCGLGISILSYNGQVQVGVMADSSNIENPTNFIHGFEESYSQLRDAVLNP